jgi:hypothetical protein
MSPWSKDSTPFPDLSQHLSRSTKFMGKDGYSSLCTTMLAVCRKPKVDY